MPKSNFIKPDEDEVIESENKETVEKKKKKSFEASDGILCRSVVSGYLYVEGIKTGMMYSFTDYGDETEIEYRDLVAAIRSKDKAVYGPRFIVEDKDFLAEFPALEKFYTDQFTSKDIREILAMPENEMVAAIQKLPTPVLETLKTMAAKQVSSGQLDSVKKIKALDEIFGTDLNLVGELFANQ